MKETHHCTTQRRRTQKILFFPFGFYFFYCTAASIFKSAPGCLVLSDCSLVTLSISRQLQEPLMLAQQHASYGLPNATLLRCKSGNMRVN
jgi:hypothetical protein